MSNNLNASSLSETLKQKVQTDREKVEQLTSKELEKLGDALRRRYSEELNSTLDDINKKIVGKLQSIIQNLDTQTAPLVTALGNVEKQGSRLETLSTLAWLRPLLISLCLLLTISLGSWGLMLYLSGKIMDQLEQIESQKETLATLESKTWGLRLSEASNGKFLILPEGMKAVTGWTVGEHSAVKLERE